MAISQKMKLMFASFTERGASNLLPSDQRLSTKYYFYLKELLTTQERQEVERTRQAGLAGGDTKEFKEVCRQIRRRLTRSPRAQS